MLNNYLTVALRTLRREKGYAAINVLGLAIAMGCCLLIGAYLRHELTYDHHLPDGDRTYRVVTTDVSSGTAEQTAMTTPHLADALAESHPGLDITRLYHWVYSDILVRHGDKQFLESRFYRADSTFLDVFALDFVRGERARALRAPHTLVLTESTAQRYFGNDDPMGQTLRINDASDYVVSGVVRDPPANTHFHFDLIAYNGRGFPGDWSEKKVWTYVKVPQGTTQDWLAERVTTVASQAAPGVVAVGLTFGVQPIRSIHLDSHLDSEIEPPGNRAYLSILSAVALLLALIASVNYVNLTTARGARRTREIGVRKALGAHRSQLARQHLVESLVTVGLAALLAGGLAMLAWPSFNTLAGSDLPPPTWRDWPLLAGLGGLILGLGLLAGSYPALYLSAFAPAQVLKGTLAPGRRAGFFRRGLVVFQFVAAVLLMVGTLVVYQQLAFMQSPERGVDRERTLVLRVPRPVAVSWNWDVGVLRDDLLGTPGIQAVSALTMPWQHGLEQHRLRMPGAPESSLATLLWVAEDRYAELYGLGVIEGRTAIRQFDPDSTGGLQFEFVLNETAAERLGLARPVGEEVEMAFEEMWLRGRIVGLVEDFHFQSLHHRIRPLVFVHGPGFSSIAVRLTPGFPPETLARIEDAWQRLAPTWPLDYTFMDDDYAHQYRSEQRLARLFTAGLLLALTIACLGLIGLASYTAAQRRKEVSIRKVLGASTGRLVALLVRDVVALALIALAFALPMAALVMDAWLNGFAYRIPLGVEAFVLSGLTALAIAFLAAGSYALRAANADPVRTLRHE